MCHCLTFIGRGTVVTGKLLRGKMKRGEQVEFIGHGVETVKTVVTG